MRRLALAGDGLSEFGDANDTGCGRSTVVRLA